MGNKQCFNNKNVFATNRVVWVTGVVEIKTTKRKTRDFMTKELLGIRIIE